MIKNKQEAPLQPTHIGLILDGNRRWAKSRGLPTLQGHKQGFDNLEGIAKAAFKRDVKYVSAFIFSTENWNRSKDEVKYLMDLAYRMIKKYRKTLDKENVRAVWIGSKERVGDKLRRAIETVEEQTKNNTGGTLCLCFNYGGQNELIEAAKKLVAQGLSPNEINQDVLESMLYAPDIPPVDLLIRTSGEKRISGYMLYRSAYAELYFVDKHWPDFSEQDLDEALEDYTARCRRFGS